MSRRVAALLVLVVLSAGFALWAVRGSADRPPVGEFLAGSLQDCGGAEPVTGRERSSAQMTRVLDCWAPDLLAAVSAYGPSDVLQALPGLTAPEVVFYECHDAAHLVASAALGVLGVDGAARAATLDCTSGYLDGLVLANVEARVRDSVDTAGGAGLPGGDVESPVAIAAAHEVCNALPAGAADRVLLLMNCYHGFGHVTFERAGGLLAGAFDGCRGLDADAPVALPEPASRGCFGGAAMALLGDDEAMSRNGFAFPGEACLLLEKVDRSACLDQTAVLDAFARGGPAPFAEFCLDAADPPGRCAGLLVQVGVQLGVLGDALEVCADSRAVAGESFLSDCARSLLLSLRGRLGSDEAARVEACRLVPGRCELFGSVLPLPLPPSGVAPVPSGEASPGAAPGV